MSKLLIRKPYDRVERVQRSFPEDEGRTQQSFKEQCDVNNILKRFQNGIVPEMRPAEYGDFLDAPDFHSAQNSVIEAREAFEALPARLRKRFGNDPAEFLSFMDDPENVPEMRAMGLLPKESPDVEGDGSGSQASIDRGGVPQDKPSAAQDEAGKGAEGGQAAKAGK